MNIIKEVWTIKIPNGELRYMGVLTAAFRFLWLIPIRTKYYTTERYNFVELVAVGNFGKPYGSLYTTEDEAIARMNTAIIETQKKPRESKVISIKEISLDEI